jgi:hypothetical protein
VRTSLSQAVVGTATAVCSLVDGTSMEVAARSIQTKKRRKPTKR